MAKKNIRILIFGGSALGQNYLGLSNLFYKKFARWLLEEYGMTCEIQLKALRSFDALPELIQTKLKEQAFDFIFIQMRPGLVNMRFNFLMRKKGNGYFNFVRNPYMQKGSLRKQHAVSSETISHSLDAFQKKSNPSEGVLATVNAFMGFSAGYVTRASTQINEVLEKVYEVGTKENTSIYVLGVFNSVRSPLVNFIYKTMNVSFKKRTGSLHGGYIDVYSEMQTQTAKGNQVFIEDQYHLSILGHEILATRLIEEFRKTSFPL